MFEDEVEIWAGINSIYLEAHNLDTGSSCVNLTVEQAEQLRDRLNHVIKIAKGEILK